MSEFISLMIQATPHPLLIAPRNHAWDLLDSVKQPVINRDIRSIMIRLTAYFSASESPVHTRPAHSVSPGRMDAPAALDGAQRFAKL